MPRSSRGASSAGAVSFALRFPRDTSRLLNRCGLANGARDVDLADSDQGAVVRRLTGAPPGCRRGSREDLVAQTTALRVTQVGHVVLRVCRRTDTRPTDVDGVFDAGVLHRWTAPTAVADTVAWVAIDTVLGNDTLSVRGWTGGTSSEHRIGPGELGSSEQRTYRVLSLTCTASGAYALLVHDNIAGRDVLYAGRLANDTGATVDAQPSGAIAGVAVDDAKVAWTAGGAPRTAALP